MSNKPVGPSGSSVFSVMVILVVLTSLAWFGSKGVARPQPQVGYRMIVRIDGEPTKIDLPWVPAPGQRIDDMEIRKVNYDTKARTLTVDASSARMSASR